MSSDKWGRYVPSVRREPDTDSDVWFIADHKIGPFGASVMIRDSSCTIASDPSGPPAKGCNFQAST
jgi:hypothetical protein